MDTKTEIRNFLLSHVKTYDLQDDDDFFELGLVNSLFAMQLVLFVENKFSITVDGDDLDVKNFNTISAIDSLIKRKTTVNLT